MKFTCNLKPFADALDLGVINSNVSNFHKKSCLVQLTATSKMLYINIESSRILTEIRIQGKGEGEDSTVFVDSLLLKQLVGTLDSNVVVLNFVENGLVIESGKSKFNLSKMVEGDDLELNKPTHLDSYSESRKIIKSDWKFVKDFQMYAISMAYIHPVYTYVWIGDEGDVLVGDFDISLFTHSKKSNLGRTCLLSDTIINLFNSLPDDSEIIENDGNYIITFKSDSMEYTTEFQPVYEEDEEVGSYNSSIFLNMMDHPDSAIIVNLDVINKLLNQAALLSTSSEDTINFIVHDGYLRLEDNNVDGQIDIKNCTEEYSVEFKLESLKRVLSNYDDKELSISPVYQEDDAVGIIVWNDDLTTIVAGVE